MFSPNNPAPIHLYAPDLSYGIEDDGSEFKQLFMALHSFKPSDAFQNSYESEVLSPTISRAGSGFTDSDSDEEVDIFAEDREDYDFEAHIPRPLLDTIRNMLDEPVPLPKESSLNPNATPFVPSSDASRVHALAASPNPHHRAPESNPQPLIYGYIPSLVYQPPPSSWTSIFADACVLPHTSPNTLSDHARDLVHSRLWNRDALAELAQHFCWKAFCPQETGRNVTPAGAARVVSKGTLAPFAVEVYRYLYLANDEETASSFLWLLKESVLGTFKATWHASESSKAISYRLSPTRSFIESGISLVSFIGDLFYVGLFDEPQISLCLSVLVNELVSLEHIASILSLIQHAQVLFWTYQPHETTITTKKGTLVGSHLDTLTGNDSKDTTFRRPNQPKIRTFLDHFLVKAALVNDGHSMLCKKVVTGEREQMVREVVNTLVEWGQCEGFFWDDRGGRIQGGMGGGAFLTASCATLAADNDGVGGGGGGNDDGIQAVDAAGFQCGQSSGLVNLHLDNLPLPPGLGFTLGEGSVQIFGPTPAGVVDSKTDFDITVGSHRPRSRFLGSA